MSGYVLFPAAFAVAFLLAAIIAYPVLTLMRKLKAGQTVLVYVDKHAGKSGTPTMGGVIFLAAAILTCAIFGGMDYSFCAVACATAAAYALLGFLDDFIKIKFKRNLGLRAYQKAALQLAVALIVGFFCLNNPLIGGEFVIPFLDATVNFGVWTVPFVVFVFLATTNGVNLTDGMDGLAGSVSCVFFGVMAILLAVSSVSFDTGGMITYAEEYFNLALFSFSLFGALLAYLIFNVFPAKIFMGDTGSLALGGAVACVAAFSKNSLLIPLVGVMFVVSVVSVILQVARFKLTRKRFFLMAPYHHHLQMKGMSEPRIVCVYTAITLIMGILVLTVG